MTGTVQPSEFSPYVLGRARKIVRDGGVIPHPDHPDLWFVQGRERTYRVQQVAETYMTCTCPWGLNQGVQTHGCSHVAAVLTMQKEAK